jgi:hypothetical protein
MSAESIIDSSNTFTQAGLGSSYPALRTVRRVRIVHIGMSACPKFMDELLFDAKKACPVPTGVVKSSS